MAIRMAQDLGLHREAEHWSRIGVSLFTPEENLLRKWVWWACVIVDKYVADHGDRVRDSLINIA